MKSSHFPGMFHLLKKIMTTAMRVLLLLIMPALIPAGIQASEVFEILKTAR